MGHSLETLRQASKQSLQNRCPHSVSRPFWANCSAKHTGHSSSPSHGFPMSQKDPTTHQKRRYKKWKSSKLIICPKANKKRFSLAPRFFLAFAILATKQLKGCKDKFLVVRLVLGRSGSSGLSLVQNVGSAFLLVSTIIHGRHNAAHRPQVTFMYQIEQVQLDLLQLVDDSQNVFVFFFSARNKRRNASAATEHPVFSAEKDLVRRKNGGTYNFHVAHDGHKFVVVQISKGKKQWHSLFVKATKKKVGTQEQISFVCILGILGIPGISRISRRKRYFLWVCLAGAFL